MVNILLIDINRDLYDVRHCKVLDQFLCGTGESGTPIRGYTRVMSANNSFPFPGNLLKFGQHKISLRDDFDVVFSIRTKQRP
jgi:hypothetical protein